MVVLLLPGVVVHSVYKLQNNPFELPALDNRKLSHIVTDFNSHSTSWGYDTTDDNGEVVEQWADSCDITLIHDAKLPQYFNSARSKKGYNSDLILASTSITNLYKKSIMDIIPQTHNIS